MPKLKMICTQCGSTDVGRDAWAEWDIEAQKWVLRGDPFDDGICFNESCETSGNNVVEAVEITDEPQEITTGDLDSPVPNHFDQTKRGFDPK